MRATVGDTRLLALILVLGAALYLPAIRSPFILDDFMHAAMVDGTHGVSRGPFDIYDFVNDRDRSMFIERGLLPWYSHPKLRVRFFRPLPSALRWCEQKLMRGQTLVMHLHSFIWWILAVLAVRRLLGRMVSRRATWLATATFALGPWHVLPLAWLANREALISLTFGALALDAHLRWRHELRASWGLASAGLFSLALLGGEYAICFGGYVLGLELARSGDKLVRRIAGMLPFVVPALSYLSVRAVLGYGSYRSAFYTDPLKEPLQFLRAAPFRAASLLTEGWLTLGTSAWGTTAPHWVIWILAVGGGVVLFVVLKRLLAALEPRRRADAIFLLAGSLISLVPVMAVQPAPRLLEISAIGMAAVVALLIEHAWFPASGQAHRMTWTAATVLAFLQLIHGPIATLIAAHELRLSSLHFERTAAALGERLPDPARAEVVVARGGAGMFFGPFALTADGAPPARWRILSHTTHALALRKDAYTLELRASPERGLFPAGAGNLFRTEDEPLHAGDVVQLSGLRIEIIEAGAAGPKVARYTFDRPLEESPLVWVQEGFAGFRDLSPPAPGFGLALDP